MTLDLSEDEVFALLVLARAVAAHDSETAAKRGVLLGAVVKLSEAIGAAAERSIAELSQPRLPTAPKRGRPPGARTRKPKQRTLPVAEPAAAPQNSGAL